MISPLRESVLAFHAVFDDQALSMAQTQHRCMSVMTDLVRSEGWLPARYAQPHPERYRQQLLYLDPQQRFSLLSFVWGPKQSTPIHDHTVWGVVGVLSGAEIEEGFHYHSEGKLLSTNSLVLKAGEVSLIDPVEGDIHQVRNALDDSVSISIHLYAGNIGEIQRHIYDQQSGERKPFISRYENTDVPNLWYMSSCEGKR